MAKIKPIVHNPPTPGPQRSNNGTAKGRSPMTSDPIKRKQKTMHSKRCPKKPNIPKEQNKRKRDEIEPSSRLPIPHTHPPAIAANGNSNQAPRPVKKSRRITAGKTRQREDTLTGFGYEAAIAGRLQIDAETAHSAETEPVPSSPSALPSSPCRSSHDNLSFITKDIRDIADILAAQEYIPAELPSVEGTTSLNEGVSQPWTAERLIHLYICCYQNRDYNSCDLIVDTWARAFRAQNDPNGDPRLHTWMPSTARKYVNKKAIPMAMFLEVTDPELARDVTDFDMSLINKLHQHTARDCGARLLWADLMALCGSTTEAMMRTSQAEGAKWHEDVIFNVMCTALRMTRKRLTLKVEEGTEGAWCKRYHQHSRLGKEVPCYRRRAKWPEEESQEEQPEKSNKDVEVRPAKQVHFVGEGDDGDDDDDGLEHAMVEGLIASSDESDEDEE